MSIQNCFSCGEVTRDTDFDLESGLTVEDEWYCSICAEKVPNSPVKPVLSKVDTKTLPEIIKRLETDLIDMKRMGIFDK